jgi:hypothetical protein
LDTFAANPFIYLVSFQFREGIYWCPAPLRNEEERSFKVRAASDVQVTPQKFEEYISDSLMGSDDDAPAARRAPPKVATSAPRSTRQTAGKMFVSRAAATIAVTQTAGAKKKKRKRAEPSASADTTTVSSDVEIINVEDEEDDAKSPSATMVPPAEMPRKATTMEGKSSQTPRKVATSEEHLRSGADVLGDAGSQKRAKKAPPKPYKPGLRSATK